MNLFLSLEYQINPFCDFKHAPIHVAGACAHFQHATRASGYALQDSGNEWSVGVDPRSYLTIHTSDRLAPSSMLQAFGINLAKTQARNANFVI